MIIHAFAEYFHTTSIVVGVWLCAIAVVVLVALGWRGCHAITATPKPEGSKK